MQTNLIILALSLGIILFSCEFFTNGIEWLGKMLNVGDGVVGSIFSAVGTCLPETMIPVIAIFFSQDTKKIIDIGIGAIVGAPFMLSTLAFFITGLCVILMQGRRKTGLSMNVNYKILSRDLAFFIMVYSLGIGASFIHTLIIRYIIAIFLIFSYIYYIILTVKKDNVSNGKIETLYFVQILNVNLSFPVILMQILFALAGIIFGAQLFVKNIEEVSIVVGISAMILSIIVTPIATELPEKFNSVIWISKRKDTLAIGNITGAMVFQSCIPVSVGILATGWKLDIQAIMSALLALLSALIIYLYIKAKRKLSPLPLLAGGVFYALFLIFVFKIWV